MSTASDLALSRRALLAAGGALLLAGPARAAPDAGRVVVLGGDLTEIAYALGAGPRLVAANSTALWPPEAEALPKVGYLRRLSAKGILSLMPDLVLASADAGPPAVLDQLRSAGLAVETAPAGTGFDAVVPKIDFVGRALGLPAEAAALAAGVEADMARVEAAVAGLPDTPSVLFLISVGRGAPMAGGNGTAADAMIRLAHARNAVEASRATSPSPPRPRSASPRTRSSCPTTPSTPPARPRKPSPSPASPTPPPAARPRRGHGRPQAPRLRPAHPRRPSPSSPAPSTPARRRAVRRLRPRPPDRIRPRSVRRAPASRPAVSANPSRRGPCPDADGPLGIAEGSARRSQPCIHCMSRRCERGV